MLRRSLLVSPLVAYIGSAFAQGVAQKTVAAIDDALPPMILTALKNFQSKKTIFPIQLTERYAENILKVDELVFGESSSLVLTHRGPWIVVAARTWKFIPGGNRYSVTRDLSITAAASGVNGEDGDDGEDQRGERDRIGNPGDHGEVGYQGATGGTINLPNIYLIAGDVQTPSGQPFPGTLPLSLIFTGIPGGRGGMGGKGGDGGDGGDGKAGAQGFMSCKEGGGRGGDGGNAGAGGFGGNGGRGGNGANITIITDPSVSELFTYARIYNSPGDGGAPGATGRAGTPGRGGSGASSNGQCGSKSAGANGTIARNGSFQPTRGAEGSKGLVSVISTKNFGPLF